MTLAEPYEGAVTGETPRLALLREFIGTYYQLAPKGKVEGLSLHRAWTVWAEPRGIQARAAAHFYPDLRYFGFMIKRSGGNRSFIYGLAPLAHMETDLVALENAWREPVTHEDRDLGNGVVSLAGAAIREAIEIKREVVEAILADVLLIARDAVDPRVKLQAYEMILKRSFPTLAVQPVERPVDDAIDVAEPVDHESLAEVEAVLTKRIAEEAKTPGHFESAN